MLQSVGSQRVGCDLETEQQQSLIRPLPLKVEETVKGLQC